MAQHANDPGTIDAFPVKRGRGRPSTGRAMSDAERARRYRERRRQAGISVTPKTVTHASPADWQRERAQLQARVERLIAQLGTARAERDSLDALRQKVQMALYDAHAEAKRLVPATGQVKRETVQQLLTLIRRLSLLDR
jgi:hypothetical protein